MTDTHSEAVSRQKKGQGASTAKPLPRRRARRKAGDNGEFLSMLAALHADVRPCLHAIRQACLEMLAEEGSEAAETEEADNPFVAGVRAIQAVCDRGFAFLETTPDSDRACDSKASAYTTFRDYVHDLKTTVSPIKYKLDMLSRKGQIPLSFETEFGEIQSCFETLLEATNRGRDDRESSAPIAPSGEHGKVETLPAQPDRSTSLDSGFVLPSGEVGHVLVVDDDRDSRDNLADLLQDLRLDVSLAEDGRQALEFLECNHYAPGGNPVDLVLLDLKMQHVDGFTVLAEMKKDYGLRSIPVVMVSAHGDVETQVRCIANGADDYLVKPPHPALLAAQVRSCLSKGWLRKQERLLGDQVRVSKQRADDLLYNIFPYTVARDLVTTGKFEPRCCDNVAVLFCDVVGFTTYCDSRPPKEVIANLNDLFSDYEDAIEHVGIEKIKTIGDCIMVTAGLMKQFENPVLSCLKCAELMVAAAQRSRAAWQVRVGIHVGPVVAGMAGKKHYSFDIWGDTVNTAARVQGTAAPDRINLSERGWSQVYEHCHGKSQGMKELKGMTSMEVFQFEGFRS